MSKYYAIHYTAFIKQSPEKELEKLCNRLKINIRAIIRPGKVDRNTNDFRMILIMRMKIMFPKLSEKRLGEIFGHRDHSTISYSISQVKNDPVRRKIYVNVFGHEPD